MCMRCESRQNIVMYRVEKMLLEKIPVNITSIPEGVLCYCNCLVSVEIPAEGITQIESDAFQSCRSLRNIALPPNAEKERIVFRQCNYLHQCLEQRKRYPKYQACNHAHSIFNK